MRFDSCAHSTKSIVGSGPIFEEHGVKLLTLLTSNLPTLLVLGCITILLHYTPSVTGTGTHSLKPNQPQIFSL
jgi:hypothetical protein